MEKRSARALDELARSSERLAREREPDALASVFVEQSIDLSRSDAAALYFYRDPERPEAGLSLFYRRGAGAVPASLDAEAPFVSFLRDCDESLIVNGGERSLFSDALLVPGARSAAALPLSAPGGQLGFLLLNARGADHYGADRFAFLDAYRKLAGGLFLNARLHQELRRRMEEIARLERYQESIFSSMTNLLVALDRGGTVRYLNEAARERFGFAEDPIGRRVEEAFAESLAEPVLRAVRGVLSSKKELLGIEGIFRSGDRSIDFSLNVAPLRAGRGPTEGLTLLFTDQSAERALKDQVQVVVEERRLIKDMFARYLSADVVENLVNNPHLVKPGGDKKNATVFFGDIRGYTSFSESKTPEYIIEVLNAYFSEAVEIIIRNKGFIDKFIGDAIMAVWGVPMQTERADAIGAVASALELQELIGSRNRRFFTGDAKDLRVGIGLHTGPLVAGNLGSARRLNYSVIGDTVNVAARLEGVAKGGEIIITETTRDLIGDRFKLKELEPVRVKGKAEPIHVFSVLSRAR